MAAAQARIFTLGAPVSLLAIAFDFSSPRPFPPPVAAPLAPAAAPFFFFRTRRRVPDVWARRPAGEAEAEGDGEVKGLELVHKLIAGPDF